MHAAILSPGSIRLYRLTAVVNGFHIVFLYFFCMLRFACSCGSKCLFPSLISDDLSFLIAYYSNRLYYYTPEAFKNQYTICNN